MTKQWVKLHCSPWIDGSIRRDLEPAERSVWADLLAMSGLSRREGYIERSPGIPFTYKELCDRLLISQDLLNSTIEKCIKEGRIRIDEYNTIVITHYEQYQAVPEGKKKTKLDPETIDKIQTAHARVKAIEHPEEFASLVGVKNAVYSSIPKETKEFYEKQALTEVNKNNGHKEDTNIESNIISFEAPVTINE